MSDLLGISGNAAAAYQLALATVSNNIANVATDGYSRQEVDLREAAPRRLGGAFIGTGVIYDRVKRQFDTFAELNLRNSTSEMSSQEPMVDYTNRVVDLLGSEDAGLVTALDDFFSSARGLTTDPASSALRGGFFRSAQGLTARFALISSQLDLVDAESREAVNDSVASINTLAQQLAAVNGQLAKQGSADRQPSELLDQRDRLLRDLSQHVGVRVGYAVNGSVTVSLGSSTASRDVIVDGPKAIVVATLSDPANQGRVGLVLDPYGQQPRALTSVTSGRLAGLLSFREQVLDGSRNSLDDIARVLMTEVNQVHRSGVDGYGQTGGDFFKVEAGSTRLASGLKLAIDDPLRIAAAAQFRVIENANNTGRADATVVFSPPQYGGPRDLPTVLPANGLVSTPQSFSLSGVPPMASVGSIPAGLKDVVVYLNDPQGDQQLQLFTRDGRHLLGSELSEFGQQALLDSGGVEGGASYSKDYLGLSGDAGYRRFNVFYGARADVRMQQAFDSRGQATTGSPLPALLQGGAIRSGFPGVADGALTLNGVALDALAVPAGGRLSARHVAQWLNHAVAADATGDLSGISARAVTEVRASAAQLKLDRALLINSFPITPAADGFVSAQGLVSAINSRSDDTHVWAYLDRDGQLVLTNTSGHEGEDILIEPLLANGGNALNIAAGVYGGRLELERVLPGGQSGPIALGFGANGKPVDLANLGFRTGAYVQGTVAEDLLVALTDSSASRASVSASYTGRPTELTSNLRANPMDIEFVAPKPGGSPLRYVIRDQATGSILAERDLDPRDLQVGISYRGLQIAFSSMPRKGDLFLLDGNPDGKGNNDNIRALASLQSARLLKGDKSIAGAYTDHVNDMGNLARQSTIARDALTVVREQAQEKRDKVAGVNLDEEAANLIRFQQAYQASAKVMQVASQLFDSILQVR